jgi:hypothetical protein
MNGAHGASSSDATVHVEQMATMAEIVAQRFGTMDSLGLAAFFGELPSR